MIFTSRFGALAARPTFPRATELEQENATELRTHDVEYHYSDESAA